MCWSIAGLSDDDYKRTLDLLQSMEKSEEYVYIYSLFFISVNIIYYKDFCQDHGNDLPDMWWYSYLYYMLIH